jgi:hypothetical protein
MPTALDLVKGNDRRPNDCVRAGVEYPDRAETA